jgi:hypothetical protein
MTLSPDIPSRDEAALERASAALAELGELLAEMRSHMDEATRHLRAIGAHPREPDATHTKSETVSDLSLHRLRAERPDAVLRRLEILQ